MPSAAHLTSGRRRESMALSPLVFPNVRRKWAARVVLQASGQGDLSKRLTETTRTPHRRSWVASHIALNGDLLRHSRRFLRNRDRQDPLAAGGHDLLRINAGRQRNLPIELADEPFHAMEVFAFFLLL